MRERSFLVYGLGLTGRAVARALATRGLEVRLADDAPGAEATALEAELGTPLAPPGADPAHLVEGVDAVVPAPGLADGHPVLAAAAGAGRPVLSEFDLAAAWDRRPVAAVTGTNGKTTVTTLVTDMLRRSGIRAVDAGNTEVPLVAAIDDPDVDWFVVEASSFRLARTRSFPVRVGTWLNFAPDHLDIHTDLAAYEAAKAVIWRDLEADGVAVANRDDPVVWAHVPTGRHRVHSFGAGPPVAAEEAWGIAGDHLVDPRGRTVAPIAALPRRLPHDLLNALAAAATAAAAGADPVATGAALEAFEGLAHRVERLGERDGVIWVDDSKSTVPHAIGAAVGGFGSVVLIAGGRNKGLDLSVVSRLVPPVRAVVGIGEAGPELVDALGAVPGVVAGSMAEAVAAASDLARRGDAVVLSPGCASFDWYGSYAERGDDFAREVRRQVLEPRGAEA